MYNLRHNSSYDNRITTELLKNIFQFYSSPITGIFDAMFKSWKPNLIFFCLLYQLISSCSNKIIPDKPFLSKTDFKIDSLPESELNIPIQVNLKPFYSIAEKKVATIFTSPNWPEDWIPIDCANRYKYFFRRSSLQFSPAGNNLNIDFTGYYKIIGSTRVCAGNAIISPWTPPCRCGFDEGERKVKVGFTGGITVLPDFKIKLNVNSQEPVPIDKCTVCFFGADITKQVMKGLKNELDLAKKAIADTFGVMDLKPQVQLLWNKLNTSFNLYESGWLRINPQKIKLNDFYIQNDSLRILLGLTAKPIISFQRTADIMTLVPNLERSFSNPGFSIFLDAVLNYDSLSNIVNAQLKGKKFDFSKSGMKKTVVIEDCRIYGTGNEKLIIKMKFSGSNEGIAYYTGNPFFDESKRTIEIRDIDFDIKTKDLFLKSANWLFNRRITTEISNVSKFDLSAYIDSAKWFINQQLNTEWIKGIKCSGSINQLKIAGMFPMTEHLVVRSNASGGLAIKVESIDFNF